MRSCQNTGQPPRYLRIVASLESKIRAGGYGVGKQLPTEQQLAARFGVARMTIRHALDELSRRGLVSREHGRGTFAVPPSAAAQREASTVMVVGPRHRPQLFLQDAHYGGMLQGVEQCLHERHYDLMLRMKRAHTYMDLARHKSHVRGLLITGYQPYFKSELRKLNRLAIPFVLMGRSADEPAVSFVDADKQSAGDLATTWLLKQGCRRVGMLIHDRAVATDAQRLKGYHRALNRAGMKFNKWLVCRVNDDDGKRTIAQVQDFVRSRCRPDALVVSVVPSVAGVIVAWWEQEQRRNGRLRALVGFDEVISAAHRGAWPCAYIQSPLQQVGYAAAQVLLNFRPDRPVRRLLPVRLVVC